MARHRPPTTPTQTPLTSTLAAGTLLYRVHQKAYPSTSFNPNPAHRYFDGGRFDGTDDDTYPFMYAGDTPEGAIAETLLRDLPADHEGAVTIPRVQVIGRRLSEVEVTTALEVVDLTDLLGLRSASQDTWLTMADPVDYAQTRHWAHWIRQQAPTAAGFVWRSKRDPSNLSYVLFEDRCGTSAIVASVPYVPGGVDPDFDDPNGLASLVSLLDLFNADIEVP